MESGTGLAPSAGLTLLNAHPALTGTIYGIRYRPGSICWPHFTKHTSSAHWHHLWNQVQAWLHLLALTLLNAHPALTGTIYGIRYRPGSICRPHFTKRTSSAPWHHLWNQVQAWLHLLVLTLLNAHPALTGTIYGIRYRPGSICWRSLY